MRGPIGSYSWAWLGGLLAIGLLLWQTVLQPRSWLGPSQVAWLNLVALFLHQFEEYIWPGGFREFFNTHIYGPKRLLSTPLSARSIFLVNVPLAWSAYLLGALNADRSIVLVAGLLLISFINGCLHLSLAILWRRYNPGVVTGCLLFIPLGVLAGQKWFSMGALSGEAWVGVLLLGIVGSLTIPLLIHLGRDR